MLNEFAQERISNLRKRVIGPPEVCIERGYLMTESYKETESEPYVIRRAKALSKVLKGMTIHIDKEELIVGRSTSKQRGAILIPEVQWEWYLNEMEMLSTRSWDRCLPIPEEDKAKMKEFLPYWKGKSLYDKWHAAVPEEVMKTHWNSLYITNSGCLSGVHLAHVGVDYEKVLTIGLNGIKKQVDAELEQLDFGEMKSLEKFHFLKAVKITMDAAIAFAERYAALARSLAQKETEPQRKIELGKIAEICSWVPANPARSFHEALQAIWFILIILRIEGLGPGITLGRPDQYLYPFFQRDLAEGKITRDEARQLLAMLLIKINDLAILMSTEFVEQLAGFPTLTNITIGGVTKEGKNAVNELSYLFLEAELDVGLTVEEFIIRVNKNNPDTFLMKACEVAKSLKGKLKFISDDTTIQQFLAKGMPVEYARDYIVAGCFTPTVPAFSFDTSAAMVNLPLILELALNNGVSRLTGEQIGPQTGDPEKFTSFDDVWNAFKTQVEAVVPKGMLLRNADRKVYADYAPCPFQSALFEGCIQKGVDITNGGTAPYITEGHGIVGLPNVGDSLAAIKKAVFEDKKITMRRLIRALDNNFEGDEEVLHLLKSMPKFGNDDDYVDGIVNDVVTLVESEISKYRGIAGTKPVIAAATGTGHLALGKVTGALPDGRKAGEPLSEGGISPHQGRNISGLTATLKSVAKLDHLKIAGGSVLNVRLNPEVLKDNNKMKKFVSLVRTYCETGGYHVQFNIVDSGMLKDAQKNPDKYRDLLVRVATYSAYFVELSTTLQNDIIARVEFQEV